MENRFFIGEPKTIICKSADMEESVADWANRHRRALKMSQAAVGKLLEVSQPQAQKRLNNEIQFSIEEIEKLERHFQAKAPIRHTLLMAENEAATQSFKVIKEYDVTVSAGGGSFVADENVRSEWPFDPAYLSNELGLGNAQLALLEVRGDSMEPTLSSGDRVMVNMSDKQVSQPGIFILYDGGGTVIKRVEKVPGIDKLVLISDNSRHTQYEIDGENVQIIGRVVWAARRM